MPDSLNVRIRSSVDTRRSQRVMARVRLMVRRQGDDDGLMSEVSHTVVVNAHGALIALAMSVQSGERLVIKHWGNWGNPGMLRGRLTAGTSQQERGSHRVYKAFATLLAY